MANDTTIAIAVGKVVEKLRDHTSKMADGHKQELKDSAMVCVSFALAYVHCRYPEIDWEAALKASLPDEEDR
uniref:Uncharacterized protein n=1 Tax=Leersia perrieri TaxID=77586 RepID=A0A0D9VQC9_9ORYZ